MIAGFATFTYIFIPILQSYNPERFLESILGFFYPLADLFLLLLVLRILFTFGPGNYGMAWRLILIGFITVTISDSFFSYACDMKKRSRFSNSVTGANLEHRSVHA
jgi:hypothetical protein